MTGYESSASEYFSRSTPVQVTPMAVDAAHRSSDVLTEGDVLPCVTNVTDTAYRAINGNLWPCPPTQGTSMAQDDIPRELLFNPDNLVSVVSYGVLFVLSALGNLTVFITLLRIRRRRSRVNLFIMHLSAADMIVTFVMLPLEVAWHISVGWNAGDIACRVLMFFRVFGFYLSSFVLVAISLDRYFAINHPLSLNDADKRGKIMLFFAWVLSAVASLPQSVIFHVEKHPHHEWFEQCVTFNFFPTFAHELAYNLFNLSAMYLVPLIILVIVYTLILRQMTRKSRQAKLCREGKLIPHRITAFPHSGGDRIEKARIRTLKMTLVIVIVFVTCWTPYFIISAWWWVDRQSAEKLDPKVQRALFIFAVSNSCVNPIVYGMYTRTVTSEVRKLFAKTCCWSPTPVQMTNTQLSIKPAVRQARMPRFLQTSRGSIYSLSSTTSESARRNTCHIHLLSRRSRNGEIGACNSAPVLVNNTSEAAPCAP